MALDSDKKAFMIQIVTITLRMTIYQEHEAQIALLKAPEALVSIPAEYLDFANVLSKELVAMLPEHTEIKTYAIILEEAR